MPDSSKHLSLKFPTFVLYLVVRQFSTTDAMHVRFETLANVAHFPFTRSEKPLLTFNPPGIEFAILICDLDLRT